MSFNMTFFFVKMYFGHFFILEMLYFGVKLTIAKTITPSLLDGILTWLLQFWKVHAIPYKAENYPKTFWSRKG